MSAPVDLQSVFYRFMPEGIGHLPARKRQVAAHIRTCRTAALGARIEACGACGHERTHFHSCRDRHCPKCQGRERHRWAEARRADILPVTYYHVVFTVPDILNPWVGSHPRALYGELFASAWATLSRFAESRLGGTLGMSAVLHTWGTALNRHVHLHCLVPGGALDAEGRWQPCRSTMLFPVRALSRHYRGHFVAGLRRRAEAGELDIAPEAVDAMLDALMAREWVVYAKPCIGHTETVVNYLARYTHRIALTDASLVAIDANRVGLRTRDRRHPGKPKMVWMDGPELVRRFLLHVLPKGFMRVRHYGLLANRCRAERIAAVRAALAAPGDTAQPQTHDSTESHQRCPRCGEAPMRLLALIAPKRYDGG